MSDDPFRALGLPPRADLSDDDVRAAWRRIAAATHPDRDDGGDPARFGAAAAAYAMLRTSYGRGEAAADLGPEGRSQGSPGWRGGPAWRGWRAWPTPANRIRGRAWVPAVRVLVAIAVCASAFVIVGWAPSSIGILAGAVTWLVATARHDIARR